MANQIISPVNSFVQWRIIDQTPDTEETCGCEDVEFCLPFAKDDDLFFQFRRTFATFAEAFAMATSGNEVAQLVILRGTGNNSTTVAANTARNLTTVDGLAFEKTITGDKEVTFLWKHDINVIKNNLVNCDECFELGLIIQDPGGSSVSINHISNCIKRICDTCFTAVIETSCDDDEYDFRFCQFNNASNRVRLPFFLLDPQGPTDRAIYTRRDGSDMITRSVTKEEWTGAVDFMPKGPHMKLIVAFEHDQVNIESEGFQNFSGGYRTNNNYNIEWNTADTPCAAQASFKGNSQPIAGRNSNCKTCADCPEIVNFALNSSHYDYVLGKQSFDFTYQTSGPAVGFVILQYKLDTDTTWTNSIQANISPINLLLDLGYYDFRMLPVTAGCLPDYTAVLKAGLTEAPSCANVTSLTVDGITDDRATFSWHRVLPTPAGLYDWTLTLADLTPVQNESGYWNTGGTLIKTVTGLTANTAYIFTVKSNCGGGSIASGVSISFTTLP